MNDVCVPRRRECCYRIDHHLHQPNWVSPGPRREAKRERENNSIRSKGNARLCVSPIRIVAQRHNSYPTCVRWADADLAFSYQCAMLLPPYTTNRPTDKQHSTSQTNENISLVCLFAHSLARSLGSLCPVSSQWLWGRNISIWMVVGSIDACVWSFIKPSDYYEWLVDLMRHTAPHRIASRWWCAYYSGFDECFVAAAHVHIYSWTNESLPVLNALYWNMLLCGPAAVEWEVEVIGYRRNLSTAGTEETENQPAWICVNVKYEGVYHLHSASFPVKVDKRKEKERERDILLDLEYIFIHFDAAAAAAVILNANNFGLRNIQKVSAVIITLQQLFASFALPSSKEHEFPARLPFWIEFVWRSRKLATNCYVISVLEIVSGFYSTVEFAPFNCCHTRSRSWLSSTQIADVFHTANNNRKHVCRRSHYSANVRICL